MLLVHEMLRRSAERFPKKQAVVCGDKSLTHRELDDLSTKVANLLRSVGVNEGDRVAICSSKNVEETVAIYGIFKSGATLVHVNPYFRESQLAHVLCDAGVSVLFFDHTRQAMLRRAVGTSQKLRAAIGLTPACAASPDFAQEMYSLHRLPRSLVSVSLPEIRPPEDSAACIVYTSGSTGRPKGVIQTHRILSEGTVVSSEIMENRASDRLISVTPFSFDGALSQLLTAVLVGGTLIQQTSTFPTDIVDTLLREKVTGFHAMPSLWRILMGDRSPLRLHTYRDLRYVSIIGERFPSPQLLELRRILEGVDFIMMYGITEAFRSTFLPPRDFAAKPLSVGKPLPGVRIRIVDEEGHDCSIGEVGEIVHEGRFVSPGYWKNPGATEKVFREGALHTGDLGWLDEDGYLFFVGRKDSVIKVQGYRVSLTEIEECVSEMTSVMETASVGVPLQPFGTAIKVFLAPHPGHDISPNEVLGHCRRRLPPYMVPSEVEILPSLPKTANNKVDRAALQLPAS